MSKTIWKIWDILGTIAFFRRNIYYFAKPVNSKKGHLEKCTISFQSVTSNICSFEHVCEEIQS